MTSSTAWPLARPTRARPTAVLPEDESMIVLPGRRAPERSPSVTRESAVRSLIDPPGLNHSHLPQTSTPSGTPGRRSRTRGVRPIASRIDSRTRGGEAVARTMRAPDPPSGAHGGRDGPRLEVAGPLEVGRGLDRRMVAADRAFRVAPHLELPEGHVQGVVAEEPAHQDRKST